MKDKTEIELNTQDHIIINRLKGFYKNEWGIDFKTDALIKKAIRYLAQENGVSVS